jgi:hypothetical protein
MRELMARHAAKTRCTYALFLSVGLLSICFLPAGCAATSETDQEPDDSSSFELPIPKEPQRPEYHAESDGKAFSSRESQKLVAVACAGAEDPSACEAQADRRLHGYRGSFSRPGAGEALIALPNGAVLLEKTSGRWKAVSRSAEVDIEQCLVIPREGGEEADASTNTLLCRAATGDRRDFGLAFFRLAADEAGQLEVDLLDAPQATDVDTSLFAGWKSEEDVIEVRFHQETEVKGSASVDFGEPNVCRYRTFGYEQTPEPALVELDGCRGESGEASTDALTPAHSTRRDGQYENRLHEPIRAHNRDFVMCYHHELERLKEIEEKEEEEKEADEADQAEEPEAPEELIAGDIHVRFVIGSSGAPVSCEVAESTMQNDNVETCLCHEILKTAFPPVPNGKFVDVTYPFSFAPAAD